MNIDNGIGTRPADKIYSQKKASVPTSSADLSEIRYYTGIGGAIMPIYIKKVLPGQTTKINLTPVINLRNPYRENFKGGFRSYFHVYYMRSRDMWERWQEHIDRTEQGNSVIETPKLYYARHETSHAQAEIDGEANYQNFVTSLTPMSPADFMGVPCEAVQLKYNKNGTPTDKATIYAYGGAMMKSDEAGKHATASVRWTPSLANGHLAKLNALPFVMYNRVCRDFYFNKQLLKDNKWWYPTNPKDFMLPFDCTKNTKDGHASNNYVNNVSRIEPLVESEYITDGGNFCEKHEHNMWANVPHNLNTTRVGSSNAPILNQLHFRQFKGDMFMSGSIYADLMSNTSIPTMDDLNLDFSETVSSIAGSDVGRVTVSLNGQNEAYLGSDSAELTNAIKDSLEKGKAVSQTTMQALASLEAWTKFRNRMARVTDNNFYNGVIKSSFGVDPCDEDGTPTYIGGGYIDIGTTTVFNTGGQRRSDGSEMKLGEAGSTGNGAGNISIPKFFSKDHGFIMVIQSIVPQVNYVGGLERWWNELLPNEEYYPDLNTLAPQGTLNKELYFACNEFDNELYNYVPKYEHLKHSTNKVCGFAQFENEFLSDASKFMKRTFKDWDAGPVFNNAQCTMCPSNFDMLPFASYTEAPFECECGIHVDAVMPIPYEVLPTENL